jgi:hypothetical protein
VYGSGPSHNADIQTFDPHFQSVTNQQVTQFTYIVPREADGGIDLERT